MGAPRDRMRSATSRAIAASMRAVVPGDRVKTDPSAWRTSLSVTAPA